MFIISGIKKFFCTLLLCIFMLEMLGGFSTALAASNIYVIMPVDGKVNIRSGASVNASVLTRLKRGTLVKKVSSKSGWWLIEAKNGNQGYVDPEYLVPYSTSSSASYKPLTGKLYYINSRSRVSVKSSPSSSAKTKGKIRGGTVVRLHGTSGSFGYIEVYNNGNRGFVPLSLLIRY